MRKIKAFTLIEVMISIFIFTTAMLGYMSFHAYSAAVLFDNESAQFAHSLAFNLVDEINSMSYDSFNKFTQLVGTTSQSDVILANDELFGSKFASSPFNIFGKSEGSGSDASYLFYRSVRVDTYSNKTQTYAQAGTYLSTLYHVDVSVYWPKKGYPNQNCFTNYSENACNTLSIPLVRSNKDYGKKN